MDGVTALGGDPGVAGEGAAQDVAAARIFQVTQQVEDNQGALATQADALLDVGTGEPAKNRAKLTVVLAYMDEQVQSGEWRELWDLQADDRNRFKKIYPDDDRLQILVNIAQSADGLAGVKDVLRDQRLEKFVPVAHEIMAVAQRPGGNGSKVQSGHKSADKHRDLNDLAHNKESAKISPSDRTAPGMGSNKTLMKLSPLGDPDAVVDDKDLSAKTWAVDRKTRNRAIHAANGNMSAPPTPASSGESPTQGTPPGKKQKSEDEIHNTFRAWMNDQLPRWGHEDLDDEEKVSEKMLNKMLNVRFQNSPVLRGLYEMAPNPTDPLENVKSVLNDKVSRQVANVADEIMQKLRELFATGGLPWATAAWTTNDAHAGDITYHPRDSVHSLLQGVLAGNLEIMKAGDLRHFGVAVILGMKGAGKSTCAVHEAKRAAEGVGGDVKHLEYRLALSSSHRKLKLDEASGPAVEKIVSDDFVGYLTRDLFGVPCNMSLESLCQSIREHYAPDTRLVFAVVLDEQQVRPLYCRTLFKALYHVQCRLGGAVVFLPVAAGLLSSTSYDVDDETINRITQLETEELSVSAVTVEGAAEGSFEVMAQAAGIQSSEFDCPIGELLHAIAGANYRVAVLLGRAIRTMQWKQLGEGDSWKRLGEATGRALEQLEKGGYTMPACELDDAAMAGLFSVVFTGKKVQLGTRLNGQVVAHAVLSGLSTLRVDGTLDAPFMYCLKLQQKLGLQPALPGQTMSPDEYEEYWADLMALHIRATGLRKGGGTTQTSLSDLLPGVVFKAGVSDLVVTLPAEPMIVKRLQDKFPGQNATLPEGHAIFINAKFAAYVDVIVALPDLVLLVQVKSEQVSGSTVTWGTAGLPHQKPSGELYHEYAKAGFAEEVPEAMYKHRKGARGMERPSSEEMQAGWALQRNATQNLRDGRSVVFLFASGKGWAGTDPQPTTLPPSCGVIHKANFSQFAGPYAWMLHHPTKLRDV